MDILKIYKLDKHSINRKKRCTKLNMHKKSLSPLFTIWRFKGNPDFKLENLYNGLSKLSFPLVAFIVLSIFVLAEVTIYGVVI